MDRLQAMQLFTKVVEMHGFSRAADAMDLPHASATIMIKRLEAHLRARLLLRTTRRLSLTPEGAEYYASCIRILAEIEQAEESLTDKGSRPKGRLRVDMPASIGRMIVLPKLDEFRSRYPEIDLMVGFGERNVDLIHEGVDCAISSGMLPVSGHAVKRLASLQTLTVSSPEYIELHGKPQSLEDLQQHVAVQYISPQTGRVVDMNFLVNGHPTEVKMQGSLSVNDAEAYVNCGAQGIGIIQAPRFMLLPFLFSGKLVEVLPEWKPLPIEIAAVYPHSRQLASKVRVFVEWLALLFENSPLTSSDIQKGKGHLADSQPRALNSHENTEAQILQSEPAYS